MLLLYICAGNWQSRRFSSAAPPADNAPAAYNLCAGTSPAPSTKYRIMPVTPQGIAAQQREDDATTRLLPAVHNAVILNAPLSPTRLHDVVREEPDYSPPRTREAMWQLLIDGVISLDADLNLVPAQGRH